MRPSRAHLDARTAFLRACALDVAVRKPGNVSADAPGHGMDAQLFLDSALAAQDGLFTQGLRVGERIEAAVKATLAVAGCNTNLGIVLLCAPLARALERCAAPADAHALATPQTLRRALADVLAELDVGDARHAFRAIAAARPGGLGHADQADVNASPQISLLAAMRLAADRDRIARAYADGFDELLGRGLSSFDTARACAAAEGGVDLRVQVERVYLGFLAADIDSHIARKFGLAAAQAVTQEALVWLARLDGGARVNDDPAWAAWDASLKARGLNPGTCADLTVATLFIAGALGAPLELAVPEAST